MSILKGEKRNLNKKAKQLRKEGIIPGVLYGKNLKESISIQFPQKEVAQFLRSHFEGSRVDLMIGEESYKALLKEVTYVPMTRDVEHLSFQTLLEGEKVTNIAKIVLVNKENVEGLIQQSLNEITYKALPSDLIEKIEVDLTGMKPGDSIYVSDLDIAKKEAYEIKTPLDSLVLSIVEPKTILTEEAEETGEQDTEAAQE